MLDRLRTLPISSWVVPASHVVASVVRNVVTAALALGAAVALGFRPHATVLDWALVLALVVGTCWRCRRSRWSGGCSSDRPRPPRPSASLCCSCPTSPTASSRRRPCRACFAASPSTSRSPRWWRPHERCCWSSPSHRRMDRGSLARGGRGAQRPDRRRPLPPTNHPSEPGCSVWVAGPLVQRVDLDDVLAATFSLIAPHLTERQRMLLFGAAAQALATAASAGWRAWPRRPARRYAMAPPSSTSRRPAERIRQHDGPKRLGARDPGLSVALDRLVDPDTRGDPRADQDHGSGHDNGGDLDAEHRVRHQTVGQGGHGAGIQPSPQRSPDESLECPQGRY
jgi:hypothetical protein